MDERKDVDLNDEMNIGINSWVIQGGHYPDFTIGQKRCFALEFYPKSLQPSSGTDVSMQSLGANRYRVCAKIVFATEKCWVIDCGVLAYKERELPKSFSCGSYVEGDLSISVDSYMYLKYFHALSGMPALSYQWLVSGIEMETTPWIEVRPRYMERDLRRESYLKINGTDARNDDGCHANYMLYAKLLRGPSLPLRFV